MRAPRRPEPAARGWAATAASCVIASALHGPGPLPVRARQDAVPGRHGVTHELSKGELDGPMESLRTL